jgi:hypothetical protein
MLVISLLMFETVFGFWGLFLSFPALYVALRIANEWKVEDLDRRARMSSIPPIATATPVPRSVPTSARPTAAKPPDPVESP